VARRASARAVWHGNPAAPRTGSPGTGGLIRRRRTARAWWRGYISATTNAPPPPFTVGRLTAADTPLAALTALTAAGGSGGVLTASDTRTGGPA